MKEIDLKTIEILLEKEINATNAKFLLIFIILNIGIALLNWYIQGRIKNQEKEIYKRKIREDRRITVIEEIYKELVSYTYIMNQKDLAKSLSKLSKLEKKLAENRLYIDKKMNDKITSFIDYIKGLMSDYRKKNFAVEEDLLNKIENEFNK